ncbi:unnamed protein product [Lactuca virosa]|uniref:Reverse transcriptase Ty1/copia-type domain-containing protein n=1 Tax=Lactuca virosa TaxID=75947 RepID=A0AAU9NTN5_9ASTR|nr:unnamed protein product [Lactuca virosa]
MDVPPGLDLQRESSGNRLFCKLNKSIYGLKQVSQQWFDKFSTFMKVLGYSQSKSDYSLFHKGSRDKYEALLVYVDDIIITDPYKEGIAFLKQQLSLQFKLKDLGFLGYFLGMEITRSKEGIFVSQWNYTLQLLEDTGLLATKPKDTPVDPRVDLNDKSGEEYYDQSKYRRLVDDDLEEQLSNGKVCVSSSITSFICANPIVSIEGKEYMVQVRDIASWCPDIKRVEDNMDRKSQQHETESEYEEDDYSVADEGRVNLD